MVATVRFVLDLAVATIIYPRNVIFTSIFGFFQRLLFVSSRKNRALPSLFALFFPVTLRMRSYTLCTHVPEPILM